MVVIGLGVGNSGNSLGMVVMATGCGLGCGFSVWLIRWLLMDG